jgi:NO-binding membrane sensor protein with MHYT domain
LLLFFAIEKKKIYKRFIFIIESHRFFQHKDYYVWAIRLSILIFVIFSFEGFAMGSRMNHNVGALNENSNWFIVGWSKTVGDLRVSHFIGMHALQVLPILSFYVLKNTKLTIGLSIIYGLLALLTLIQALQGRPLFKYKDEVKSTK